MNDWDTIRLAGIKRKGANAFWDDTPSHENPFICGNYAREYHEDEFQAWMDGWNQAEYEIMGKEF